MSANEKTSPRIVDHFSLCDDPRRCRIQHKLIDILVIIILATMCGEEGWEGFVDWATDKEEYLRRFLPLSNGIPSPDTLRRVVERVDVDQFLSAFIGWTEEVKVRIPGQMCFDGKTLRKAGSPLHIVSAWCEANRMVLGAVHTEQKGKEIPAIDKLLDLLILQEGDIVTIDAIGCQQQIISKIVDQKADYVIALKGNQGNLHGEVENYFFQAVKAPVEAHCEAVGALEVLRGRSDIHEVWVTQNLDWLPQLGDWPGLRSLIMVERRWEAAGKKQQERRYYISSLRYSPEQLGHLIRRHWSIENEFHWHLDVTMKEDESDIGAAANKNLRVARTIALNLLREDHTYKRGLRAKMRRCHRSEAYLDQVLSVGNF
ncbi:MAG: ISAs1 family transposase [Parachlamydiales bacterium]